MSERILDLGSMVILSDGAVLSGEEAIEARRREQLGKEGLIPAKLGENGKDKRDLQALGKRA